MLWQIGRRAVVVCQATLSTLTTLDRWPSTRSCDPQWVTTPMLTSGMPSSSMKWWGLHLLLCALLCLTVCALPCWIELVCWLSVTRHEKAPHSISPPPPPNPYKQGHILGLTWGTWQYRGCVGACSALSPNVNVFYQCINAQREFANAGCPGQLPIETAAGEGSACSHCEWLLVCQSQHTGRGVILTLE